LFVNWFPHKNTLTKAISIYLLLSIPLGCIGQTITLSGVVRDDLGEKLPSAHLSVLPDSLTTTSNAVGQFSIRVSPGEKRIQITYVGYEVFQQTVVLRRDTTVSISMKTKVDQLKEVVVRGQRNTLQEIFDSNQTSTHVLTQEDVSAIPVLGGEADVIKTLQLLPGTVRGVEGSSDLFVRGGAADQNLVLLDDAPIYNTSHLFGFLSVFNVDVLDHVEAINGGFPASYGGRLSSILDVKTKSNIPDKTHVSGDIGLLASRLYIEQPVVKDKASFWIAGRRSYIDQVIRVVGEELPYFFYDLNGKVILKPSPVDRIELSYYSGEDILDLFRDRNNDGDGFLTSYSSGNSTQSARWNRNMKNNWYSTVSLLRTRYRYNIRNAFEENELIAFSDIEDYGARALLQKDSLWANGSLKAGVDWTRHRVSPNIINTSGTITELLESSSSSGKTANELAVHFQYEWSPMEKWRINIGMRGSMAIVGQKKYIYPEPRISARVALRDDQALKFSYSKMTQYMHRISNSAVSSPTDIWYPVTETIRPQTAHQIAVAWQKNFRDQKVFFSAESYYKTMNQLIGYEEGTNLFLNTDFESKLIQGKGLAYGLELLLRKDAGKFTGWLSYTLSWSWRQFDEINAGQWFPSRYDRRHNGAIVAQYAFHKRWAVSMVWEFISGSRFTPIIGQYVVVAPTLTGVDLLPIYSGINEVKLANSHRLDMGVRFKSKPGKKFQWNWFVGVYNGYNRASPIGISIEQDESDGSLRYRQPGLFGLLPFVSYGFKF
jgi:CarboxypepD_reg-like domain/TonB-dependent Receptor Plug Domain